jgi:hypothetical protein
MHILVSGLALIPLSSRDAIRKRKFQISAAKHLQLSKQLSAILAGFLGLLSLFGQVALARDG